MVDEPVPPTEATAAPAEPAAQPDTTAPPTEPVAPPAETPPAEAAKPARRAAPVGAAAEQPVGPITKVMLAALWPVGLVLRPFGWFFRIREPLPLVLKGALPVAFLAVLIWIWSLGTTGRVYLGSFARLGPIDEFRAKVAKELEAAVEVETEVREQKLWNGEKKSRLVVTAVKVAKATLDAKKTKVDELLGATSYEVDPATAAGPNVRLAAKAGAHLGMFDPSEIEDAVSRLEKAIPGIQLEKVDEIDAPGTDHERAITILMRATAPDAAVVTTAAKEALDHVVGEDSWKLEKGPAGTRIEGVERIETRKVSPALLPSPREMVNALPSLVNHRWKTWEDAKHWWRVGSPEHGKSTPKSPDLDWDKPNDVPFTLAGAAYERLIGPEWKDWVLLHAVTWSTIRILMGFLYAAFVAVPLGVLMGSFSKPRTFFEPLRLMGSYLPLPAMFSLTLIWWGTTETQKIAFLGVCSFVVLLPQVVMAVEAIPQAHIDAARTLGATRWQQMRHVLLAESKAEIFRSLRLTFAVGWTWIIFAEMVNPIAGLGYVIQLGERRPAHRPHIYAVVLLIIFLAYLINTTWAWVERKLYPYRDEDVT